MPRLSTLYLFCYNALQTIGWAISLFRIISQFISTKSLNGAYAAAGDLICLLQTFSFLEVLHGAIGLVPTGVLMPLMQWGGRTHFLLAIVRQIVEVQELPPVFIAFVAWGIGESSFLYSLVVATLATKIHWPFLQVMVIRYSHYAFNCIGSCPAWLTYLRYTAFIIVYPVGVAVGEMWLMYEALPFIEEKNLYANYFNKLHFSYNSFVVGLLALYPFLWLKLYLHLFKQRRSKLRRTHEKKH